ncbi:MAG: IS110 family transposase [Candidatus Methylomirabilales bacterium]
MGKLNKVEAKTVGLDLGDRFSHVLVIDAQGQVVEEGRVAMREETLRKRFSGRPRMRIALETGTHSPWVSRVLKDCGHEVIVANSRKLRLIYENPSKDDRVDALYLARLARVEPALLSPVQHRGASTQRDLTLLRSRDALVSARTQLINHVRGLVKSVGSRLPACSTRAFPKKVCEHTPQSLQPALLPVLEEIASLNDRIKTLERQIQVLADEGYPQTKLLRQVGGVGPITSLAFVLTLEAPERFAKSRTVGAFLGLVPGRKQSGGADPQRRITKQGDRSLRRLLVNAAHYILGPFGPDCDLRRFGLKIASRGGKNAKKRAIVAVARKLAVLLHHLWRSAEVYDPLYTENHRADRHGKVA